MNKVFKNKMTRIKVVPKGSGEMMLTDLEAGLARAYLMAKRKIKMKDFKIHAGIKYNLSQKDDNGEFQEMNHTTKPYANAEKGEMFQEFFGFFAGGEYDQRLDINCLEVTFDFAEIPSGSSGPATTGRDLESVYNQKSVVKIVNDDNNCFWYAMACLTDPENKEIKKARRPKPRERIGKELCHKSKCEWGQPVSFLQIPLVGEKLNCNIYILDVWNIPMLGTSVELMMADTLMYKSEKRHGQHYFFTLR